MWHFLKIGDLDNWLDYCKEQKYENKYRFCKGKLQEITWILYVNGLF